MRAMPARKKFCGMRRGKWRGWLSRWRRNWGWASASFYWPRSAAPSGVRDFSMGKSMRRCGKRCRMGGSGSCEFLRRRRPRWPRRARMAAEDTERARVAVGEELAALLHHHSAEVLLALLDNRALDE